MKERREIEDQILKCEINLNDEVEMKLMDNKKMVHSNAWRSHCKTTEIFIRAEEKCTHCCLVYAHKYW